MGNNGRRQFLKRVNLDLIEKQSTMDCNKCYGGRIVRYKFMSDALSDLEASTSEKERDVVLLPPASGNKEIESDEKNIDNKALNGSNLPQEVPGEIEIHQTDSGEDENNKGNKSRKTQTSGKKSESLALQASMVEPPKIISYITEQTSFYARQDKNEHNFMVTKEDICHFLGLILISGYHNVPSENDYWFTAEDMQAPIFSKTMSRDNFRTIKSKNVAIFAEHEALPVTITRTLPCTNSTDLFESLVQNNGKYHKTCRNKYDNQAHGTFGRPKTQGEDSSCTSTRSSYSSSDLKQVCIFCDGSDGVLSAASTPGLGPTIHGHAVQLKDQTLIRKLTSTDIVAMEAKYHKPHYRSFLNRVRSFRRSSEQHQIPNSQQIVYGSVITELVRYMEDIHLCSEIAPVFKLNDLTKLVAQRMSNMGVPTTEQRLKESLLSFIPRLRTYVWWGSYPEDGSSRTGVRFSVVVDDQYHEQNNKIVKEDGGTIRILDNETALLKWMVAGPITSQLKGEFEKNLFPSGKRIRTLSKQHKNTKAFDDRFRRHVDQFIAVLNDPFEGNILVSVNSRKIIPEEDAVQMVKETYQIGTNTLLSALTPLNDQSIDIIPKNKVSVFISLVRKNTSAKEKIKNLRRDANIYCKLYVASQSRESDIKSFFAYENQPFPPSLSEVGRLRKPSNKQNVIACLEFEESGDMSSFTAMILNGAAVVHLLEANKCKTFADFYNFKFKPYIDHILHLE
ncbi:hypothetical protein ILUMI_22166 [Ignelater luminosus]|uniref:PiggyBac transposable element-derived protein domain-containing protein n=1 Tax=Ignelater luminosus TaxID=2038154 RepID=A0A8K0CB68_IGNLU|nr:hypothetical protein ILUMI_22166 [Ignelater luminosus]